MDRSSALSRLRAAVTGFARRHPADRWCVGLSGGADSLALTAVSAAALTIYDMCKAVQRDMEIDGIHLCRKSGGRSGDYERKW